MTPARNYLPQLDGVRAISIALVLLLHCVQVPGADGLSWLVRHAFSIGWAGVDLFFALSGFLITGILLEAKSEAHYFRNFYARRFLRIFPLYYAVLIVLKLGGWSLFPFGPVDPAWPYFTYTSNYYYVYSQSGWLPLSHAWSLAIEEQYYLVFPAVVLLCSRKWLSRLLWIIVFVSPVVRVFTYQSSPDASHLLTHCRLDVLAMGGLAAMNFQASPVWTESETRRAKVAFWVMLTLASVMWSLKLLDFRGFWHNLVGLSLVDAVAALFVLLVAKSAWGALDSLLRHPLPRALGRISYGVYLLHFPIHLLVYERFGNTMEASWLRTAIVAVVSVGATLLAATLSWHLLEKPMLSLKRFFSGTGQQRHCPAPRST